MSKLVCKKCSSDRYVKSGHTRGHQRYKCKECGCQFTNTAHRGVHSTLKSLGIVLYGMCGVSMGKIGKMFGVSTPAVLKWIRKEGANIDDPTPQVESGIVMLDEMWHFVDGKKTKFGSGGPSMVSRARLLDGSLVTGVTQQPKS